MQPTLMCESSNLRSYRRHEFMNSINNRNEQFSVDVKHPYRLLLVAAHAEIPRKPNGGLDWLRITEARIIEVADTYGT